MRTLAITQNITLDGAIEMLGEWFDPQGQAEVDNSDLLAVLHRHSSAADGLLVGRRTFEDLRGYWPNQTDDGTGVTAYLNQVQKYVVSSTLSEPGWQHTTVLAGDPVAEVRALKEKPGRDIVVTGSISLCHTLIAAGLVDPSCRAAAAGCFPTASSCPSSGDSKPKPSAAASRTPVTRRRNRNSGYPSIGRARAR